MAAAGFTIFDTAIGACGIAWGERGIVGVALPDPDEGRLRARLHRRAPEAREAAPPAEVARAVERIVALLEGGRDGLEDVQLDMEQIEDFERRVYAVARAIPPGETLTYGEVAARIGLPGAAQAVGQAMGANPFPIVVPCHRVVAAGGKLGGFSAPGGNATKQRMLVIEGALPEPPPALFDADALATPTR